MANIEDATLITDLNKNWPEPGDPISEGDDHIRLIKSVLLNSFVTHSVPRVNITMTEGDEWNEALSGYDGRWNTWTKIGNPVTVSNITSGATILIDVTGSAGSAGTGSHQALMLKLVDGAGKDLTDPEEVVGFNHASGSNFEILGSILFRSVLEDPGTSLEFDIWAKEANEGTSTGGHLNHCHVVVTENH